MLVSLSPAFTGKDPMPRSLATVALLLLLAAGSGQASPLAPSLLTGEYDLLPYTTMLEDPSRQMGIDDVVHADRAGLFQTAANQGPSYGFRDEALWFRISIDFTQTRSRSWHLVQTHPLLDQITFFMPQPNRQWDSFPMGDTLPYHHRLYDHREFIMPIPREVIDGPQPVTFYVRAAGQGALNVDLQLSDANQLVGRTNAHTWALGLFYGGMLAILLYNLPLWISARERAQFYYIVFLAGLIVVFMSLNGLGLQHLWPDTPAANGWFPFFVCIAMAGATQFTRVFLDTPGTAPRIDAMLRWVMVIAITVTVTAFFLSRRTAYMLGTVLPVAFVLAMFAAGVVRQLQGYRPARLFLVGWGVLLIGSSLTAVGNLGAFHSVSIAQYAAQIGVGLHVALLSLALGDRVRYLKQENTRISQELLDSTRRDMLTGLDNRAELESILPQQLSASLRDGNMLAVLYVDMKNFRAINDTYGHDVGDAVLRELARRLKDLVGRTGRVFRITGDEFSIVMPQLSHAEDAILMAHNTIAVVSVPFKGESWSVHLNCCVGISIAEEPMANAMTLIQHADLATEQAKRSGYNQYAVYTDDLNSRAVQQIHLRNELQAAIRQQGLSVMYQPCIDRISGRPVGFEALVRWLHPERGIIPTREFLTVAEEGGQIVEIDRWVLDTACRDCAALIKKGLRGIRVAVNISALHFQSTSCVSTIESMLRKHRLPGENLEIDVTETVLLENLEIARANIDHLRKLGVVVSIDDFGTGYSSLARLRHLPVDRVKIDSSFVQNVISDVQDAAIVKSIISMAHNLNLRVFAEGVENEAQYEFLKRFGCDLFQGNLFSPPLAMADLESYMFRERTTGSAREDLRQAETILLVDDEPNILRALTRVLRKDGYNILTAESAALAFDLLARNDVKLIISDQRMPNMTGTEFLARVKDIYPETIRIVLSGYTDLKTVTDAVNQGAIYRFLTKPWDDEVLREEIHRALSQRKHA